MKNRYVILKKIPFLLPFFYIIRIFTTLFDFKKTKVEMNSLNKITQEEKDKVKDLHNKLGVKNKL